MNQFNYSRLVQEATDRGKETINAKGSGGLDSDREKINPRPDPSEFRFRFVCSFLLHPPTKGWSFEFTYRNGCRGVVLERLGLSVLEEHLEDVRHRRHTQIAEGKGRRLQCGGERQGRDERDESVAADKSGIMKNTGEQSKNKDETNGL